MSEIVYLTGPMTGLKHNNAPAFDAAADNLERRSYTVINPSAIDREDHTAPAGGLDWITALKRDIPLVTTAHVLAVMDGWEDSDGAKLEVYIALRLGLPIIDAVTTRPINLCGFAPPIVEVMDRNSPGGSDHGFEKWRYISGRS